MRWLYARLGRRYVRRILWAQMQGAHVVVAGGSGLLQLFIHADRATFIEIFVAAQVLVVVDNLISCKAVSRLLAPADAWMAGDRASGAADAAWTALARLPMDFLRTRWLQPLVGNIVPISVFAVWRLDVAWLPALPALMAASAVVLLYGALLRFFAMEIIVRPVLEAVASDVDPGLRVRGAGVSLKTRLLVALPAINIVSGVVVSALAAGGDRSLADLGIGVGVAIGVAFTVSLELTLLLANSILQPLTQLRVGTDAVAAGDFAVRVPVMSGDETGRLAASFNAMVAGLGERERLREAFGAYVDPGLAERVLAEGTELAGQEVQVTVLFVDIRDFTAFAERASAREVVGQLNAFYDLVVPVLAAHGGHANKFVGDGVLGVFGAPGRLDDHADRAVAAAREIVAAVDERFGGAVGIGIGVNSGPVVAGTIGGGGRVEFTVIGDPVNTASRVEAVTRQTGDSILLTEATRCLLNADHGELVERPTVELKGKRVPVRIYAPAPESAGGGEARGGEDVVVAAEPSVGSGTA